MRKLFKPIQFFCVLFVAGNLFAQDIVLQPAAEDGNDAFIYTYNKDDNIGSSSDFVAAAWSAGGTNYTVRNLIRFNLDTVPDTITIFKATLSLYSYDSPDNGSHSTISGSNSCVLQRVTSNWAEDTVTWNTQPTTTQEGQVVLDSSVASIQHYIDIDVTDMVQYMHKNPGENFGFMFKLQTEAKYRKMLFASSDHSDANLHPKLEITFCNSCSCDSVVTVYDTVVVYDTIAVYDTVAVNDTIQIYNIVTVYDSVHVTDTLFIDVDLTYVGEKSITNTVKVYPNPTKDIISIHTGEYANMSNYTIRFINMNTEVVFESYIDQQEFEVNISEFGSTGVYFIQLLNQNMELVDTRKIILE